jgi:hypothetical protein
MANIYDTSALMNEAVTANSSRVLSDIAIDLTSVAAIPIARRLKE